MIFPAGPSSPTGLLPQGKASAGNLHQQIQYMAAANAMANRRQAGLSLGNMPPYTNLNAKGPHGGHRPILVSHSHPLQINHGVVSQQIPLVNSPSSGNILHVS